MIEYIFGGGLIIAMLSFFGAIWARQNKKIDRCVPKNECHIIHESLNREIVEIKTDIKDIFKEQKDAGKTLARIEIILNGR